MNIAHDLLTDPPDRAAAPQAARTSWYAQGLSDGLGDRLLMFDNTGAASLELLRFTPALATAPGFDDELRESVRRLASFKHPGFAQARSVQYLEGDEGLALVSTHILGKRLTEVFQRSDRRRGMHPAFVTWMIGELAPALTALHAHGGGIAHGVLTADRIVLTRDRRLVIVEHAVGSALDVLCLTAGRLWTDLGIIPARTSDLVPRLDSRGDIVQLGLIALSSLLGRKVTPEEYHHKLESLLDEFVEAADLRAPALIAPLREWLERILLRDEGSIPALGAATSVPFSQPAATALIGPAPLIGSSDALESFALSPVDETAIAETDMKFGLSSSRDATESLTPLVSPNAHAARRYSVVLNVAIALGALALIEAILIGRLVTSAAPTSGANVAVTIESPSPGDPVLIDGKQVGVTPYQVSVGSALHSIRVVAREAEKAPLTIADAARPAPNDARAANALALAAQRQRSGGVRLTSPIELKVLEGERVLGSSADGPIVAPAGVHQLEFINTAFGYRSRQTVEIKSGQIVSLKVQPPDGKVSINAQPWAQVWIDGNAVGETPLANLSVPVGEHEITFRHPQLGERRETTIVKSGALTRISATLSR